MSPERVERAMARLHPLCRSTQFRGQRGESAPCWRSIRQHLQHHCADGATPAAPPAPPPPPPLRRGLTAPVCCRCCVVARGAALPASERVREHAADHPGPQRRAGEASRPAGTSCPSAALGRPADLRRPAAEEQTGSRWRHGLDDLLIDTTDLTACASRSDVRG